MKTGMILEIVKTENNTLVTHREATGEPLAAN
jgi:hypothetical protein